jgi:transposase InsO family protein
MLNVIDTFYKFAWALPIKKKDGATVSKAFEKIIKDAKSRHLPSNLLHTDKGLEFENKHFKALLNNYGIHTRVISKVCTLRLRGQ